MKLTHGNAGFTLTEVLVALTLFSIVAAGLAATSVGSAKNNKISKNLAAATALVQDKVEQFRTFDPDTNPPDLTAGAHNDPLNPITPTGTAGGPYTRQWVVTKDTPAKALSRVVVTVSWTGNSTYTVTGVTYVCTNRTCS